MRILIVLLVMGLLGLLSGCSINRYYVVRHADRPVNGADALTEEGLTRAKVLGDSLRTKGIRHILVTPFNRTRLTALPLSEYIRIPITEHSPTLLATFVDNLKSKKTSLVVGHSDTVLQTVSLLGVRPTVSEILPREFDRLFIVTRKKVFLRPVRVSLIETRYGTSAH